MFSYRKNTAWILNRGISKLPNQPVAEASETLGFLYNFYNRKSNSWDYTYIIIYIYIFNNYIYIFAWDILEMLKVEHPNYQPLVSASETVAESCTKSPVPGAARWRRASSEVPLVVPGTWCGTWKNLYLVAHPTNRKWVITPVIYMG